MFLIFITGRSLPRATSSTTRCLYVFFHCWLPDLFILLLVFNAKKKHAEPISKTSFVIFDIIKIIITFGLVTIGWIIFRADSLSQALVYLKNIVYPKGTEDIMVKHPGVITTMIFVVLLLIVEWKQKNNLHALYINSARYPRLLRYAFYCILIICLIWFGGKPEEFIYFQF
jgi:alginate O-acetyltransferase complex protein AlgI